MRTNFSVECARCKWMNTNTSPATMHSRPSFLIFNWDICIREWRGFVSPSCDALLLHRALCALTSSKNFFVAFAMGTEVVSRRPGPVLQLGWVKWELTRVVASWWEDNCSRDVARGLWQSRAASHESFLVFNLQIFSSAPGQQCPAELTKGELRRRAVPR